MERVSAAKFPPTGSRGIALSVIRASEYGSNLGYRAAVDREVFIAVQIETASGAKHAAEIAEVEGVDLSFIGPSDLAGDLGLEGDPNLSQLIATIDGVINTLVQAGRRVGTMPHAGRTWQALASAGVTLHAAGSDIVFMRQGVAYITAECSRTGGY